MTRTLSEGTVLASVLESAYGVTPTTLWRQHQPNNITKYGAAVKKLARDPLGGSRQLDKGDVVDQEAPVEWDADCTMDLANHFAEAIMMAGSKHNGGTGLSTFRPTAFTSIAITVAASGALQAGTLIYTAGAALAANNGLKVVGAASGATSITQAGGAAETVSGYLVKTRVAGFRGASGDLRLDANGNLTSTVADFTTMGLVAAQWIWVGGATANSFATAGYRGFAQIVTIAANLLTLRRRSWTVGSADTGTGKLIDIYFGRWVRNVNMQSADYLESSYSFEVTYATLSAGSPMYEYVYGAMLSQLVIDLPVTSKITATMKFVGGTVLAPTTSRMSGASSMDAPLDKAMFNTSTGMTRIRFSNTDETGLSTDVRSIKITLDNMVTREVVLGYLGAKYENVGKFKATVDGEVLFTNDAVVAAASDNRTCMFETGVRSGDGGLLIDIPSLQIDTTDRVFTRNESVVIKAGVTGFADPTYAYTCGITIFPYLPAS